MRIDFVKFSHHAICPTKSSADTAGFDLHSVEDVIIPPSDVRIVWTDIGFKIPRGYFGKVYSRSSFALQFMDVGDWMMNAYYRGPVAVIFFNFSNKVFEISKGSRFAQIIFQKIAAPTLTEVDKFENSIQRGQGSFGSTGLKYVR